MIWSSLTLSSLKHVPLYMGHSRQTVGYPEQYEYNDSHLLMHVGLGTVPGDVRALLYLRLTINYYCPHFKEEKSEASG